MKTRLFASALVLVASGMLTTSPQALLGQEQPEGVEVLTRGPVHEAFAEPITLAAGETMLIQKEPPKPIEELPPDAKPEGDNVIWIPGYWAWDDEREDFLWISGVWRDAPPGQEWVPGYWSVADKGGYYWTPGFWASAQVEEVNYLPEPPATIEEGPTSPQPSADHFWVPGVWRYRNDDYAWRPGYWYETQPDWVWMPAHYSWCPSGYVYVDGYWDYPLAMRGVLFAPVYFTQPVYVRPAYYYSPTVVINTGILSVHLFTRPSYCHYYFGDYYGSHYADVGFYPWYSYHSRRHCYDPLFVHDRWNYGRGDRNWERGLQVRYQHYRDHEDERPVHTFAAQRTRGDRGRGRDNITLAVSLNQAVSVGLNFSDDDDNRSRVRFQRLDRDERNEFRRQGDRVREFAERRVDVEGRSNRATRDRSARQSLSFEGVARTRTDDDSTRRGRGDDLGRDGDRDRNRDSDAENRSRELREQFGDRSRGRDRSDGDETPSQEEREGRDRSGPRDTARTSGDDSPNRGGDSLEERLRTMRELSRSGDRGREAGDDATTDGADDTSRLRGPSETQGRATGRAGADDSGSDASDLRSRIERDVRERAGSEDRGSSGDLIRRRGSSEDAARGDTGAAEAELRSRIQTELRERARTEGSSGGDAGRSRAGGDNDAARPDIRRETPEVGGERSGRDRPDIRLEGSDRSDRIRQLERRPDGSDAGASRSSSGVGSADLGRMRQRESGGDAAARLTQPQTDPSSVRINPSRGGERSGGSDIRSSIPNLSGDRGSRSSRSSSGGGLSGRSDTGAGQMEAIRRAAESRRAERAAPTQVPGPAPDIGSESTPSVLPNIGSGQDRGDRGNEGRRGRRGRD